MMIMQFKDQNISKDLDEIGELLGIGKQTPQEVQLKEIKRELKDWEKQFFEGNGRRPDKSDIKAANMGKYMSKIAKPNHSA